MLKHLAFIAALLPALAGCSTNPFTGESQLSDTAIGAGAGGALGAGAGLAVGSITKSDPKQAALIGAGAGAVAGAGLGLYMDSQQAKLRQELQEAGISVTQTGKVITLSMESNVTFAPNDAHITPHDMKMLNAVAKVLAHYPQTRVLLDGRSAATETAIAGADISSRRAEAVAAYLSGRKISPKRMALRGLGSSAPLAPDMNATASAANRSVMITLQQG